MLEEEIEKEQVAEEKYLSTSEESEDIYYSSSGESDLEKDYFGESEEDSVSEEGAWEDSESCEERLREKHKTTATWINNKPVKKEIEIKQKRLTYSFDRYIFKTNFNIKIMRSCNPYLVLVDTMNIVYILRENLLEKSLKVEKFRIDDIVSFNKKIYLINSKCGHLKEIDENLNIDNVEKTFVRNMRKGFASEFLYILGDTTIVVNKQLNCITEYYDKLISITEFDGKIFGLNTSGDVLVFSKELVLEKKVVFDEGVSFKELYSSLDYLVVNTTNSVLLIDKNLHIVKDIQHLKNPVRNIVYTKDHLFCFSSAQGGLKIVDKNLNFNNSFPRKKIRLPESNLAISQDDSIYIASHRDVHRLNINYE